MSRGSPGSTKRPHEEVEYGSECGYLIFVFTPFFCGIAATIRIRITRSDVGDPCDSKKRFVVTYSHVLVIRARRTSGVVEET